MYYVEKGTPLEMNYCITSGPPFVYWNKPKHVFNNIPDHEASTL